MTLSDTSTDANLSTLKEAINWGDGTPVTTHVGAPWSPLTHTYTTAGTFNITLKVKNQYGLTSTKKQAITVTTTRYTISGTVTAVVGGVPPAVPVSGATVTITGTNYNRTFYTDSTGHYTTYSTLKAGTYTVTMTKSGYTFPAGVSVTVPSNATNNVAGTKP